LSRGFDLVADEVHLLGRLEGADPLATGEGFADAESFDGKVVDGALALAGELALPAPVIAGEVFDAEQVAVVAAEVSSAPVTVVSLVERFGDQRARKETLACVGEVVADHLSAQVS